MAVLLENTLFIILCTITNKMSKNYQQKNNGFAVLFAVVGAALVLSIGLTIATITTKQVQLSAISRDSQFAFYAADSAVDCLTVNKDSFPTHDPVSSFDPTTIECGRGNIFDVNVTSDAKSATTTMKMEFGTNSERFCAYAQIEISGDMYDLDADGTNETFLADNYDYAARGYNMACSNLSNPRTLERGYEIR